MSGWIEYDSNNSGGSFWLKDADWQKLEDAGWHINWITVTDRDNYQGGRYVAADSGPTYGDTWEEATKRYTVGEPRWSNDTYRTDERIVAVAATYDEAVALRKKHKGYFGTLAVSCVKQGDNPDALIEEWENITGQRASDEGCNCCGPPHSFEWHADDGTTKRSSTVVTKTKLVWS